MSGSVFGDLMNCLPMGSDSMHATATGTYRLGGRLRGTTHRAQNLGLNEPKLTGKTGLFIHAFTFIYVQDFHILLSRNRCPKVGRLPRSTSEGLNPSQGLSEDKCMNILRKIP